MGRKRISREKIINAFLFCAFDKSAGATSLQDIADFLEIKKASLYNHFGSKDEMYDATLVYCSDYLNFVNFIPEDINRDGKIYEEDAYDGFRKIIKRHIQLYENEPLFQIFTFVHSEKYFNKNAAEIAENELIKIERGIAELVKGFAEKEKLRRTMNCAGSQNGLPPRSPSRQTCTLCEKKKSYGKTRKAEQEAFSPCPQTHPPLRTFSVRRTRI